MSQNNYIVYRHTAPSEKVYIGITKQSVKLRWRSGRGYKHCTIFLLAINKYKWENIQHEILLENQPELSAKYAEIYLIKWYKMHNISYNVTDGGEGGVGKKMSIEARRKMSEKAKERYKKIGNPWKGKHHTEETKLLLSNKARERYKQGCIPHMKGKHLSEETKRKLSVHFKGKPSATKGMKMPEEFCRKMSEARKGKTPAMSREKVLLGAKNAREKRIKSVQQFDINVNYIQTFESITIACLSIGKDRQTTSICAACSGKLKTAFGYIWKYNI